MELETDIFTIYYKLPIVNEDAIIDFYTNHKIKTIQVLMNKKGIKGAVIKMSLKSVETLKQQSFVKKIFQERKKFEFDPSLIKVYHNDEILNMTLLMVDDILRSVNCGQDHGLKHMLAVIDHAEKALLLETKLNKLQEYQVLLACALHDVDDEKLFGPNVNYKNAMLVCNVIVPYINFKVNKGKLTLRQVRNYTKEIIEMIKLVPFSKNGFTVSNEFPLWYYIPRDADRLEATGMIGIARCYAYSKKINRPLYSDSDPRVKNREQLDVILKNFQPKPKTEATMMDHFYEKLVKIDSTTMVTKNMYMVKVANFRHSEILNFVYKFGEEGKLNEEYLESIKCY